MADLPVFELPLEVASLPVQAILKIPGSAVQVLLRTLFHGRQPVTRTRSVVILRTVDSRRFDELKSYAMLQGPDVYLDKSKHEVALVFANAAEAIHLVMNAIDAVPGTTGAVDLGPVETGDDLRGYAVERARSLVRADATGWVRFTAAILAGAAGEELPALYEGWVRTGNNNERVQVWSVAAASTVPRRRVRVDGELKWSRAAATIATILTCLRIPCGLVCLAAFATGRMRDALIVYAIGLATDVADGLVARTYNGETSWGKRYDRINDMVFNTLSVLGLCAHAAMNQIWWLVGAALGATFLPVTVTRLWVKPNSRVAKLRSGFIRAGLVLVVLGYVGTAAFDPAVISLFAVVGIIGGLYEWRVITVGAGRSRSDWLEPVPEVPWAHSGEPGG